MGDHVPGSKDWWQGKRSAVLRVLFELAISDTTPADTRVRAACEWLDRVVGPAPGEERPHV